ncbi:NosD domain-containing protein [Methanosarcina sp. DH1]|uniref:NosD domain-containing protein n=1 Tax=Methanosarcina sp. DH1 TaxID=2605695 RepID=UPI001E2C4D40
MWVNKFIILLVVTIFFMILIHSPASAREILVGNSSSGAAFPSIQEAVNDSSPGDIILVYPGIYNESVNIGIDNLNIHSASEKPEDTVIQTFNLAANNIVVSGFSIHENVSLRPFYSSGQGFIENCIVKNNLFLENSSGILLDNCYNSTFEKNIIIGTEAGIRGSECYNCIFSNNRFSNSSIHLGSGGSEINITIINNTFLNGQIGINYCSRNKILNNTIQGSGDSLCGIGIVDSHDNIIDNNSISNCLSGISAAFISSGNQITNNTLTSNTEGIIIAHYSSGDTIKNNTISNNDIGISLGDIALVIDNKIERNRKCGISLDLSPNDPTSTGTILIYNNFFNNTVNLFNNTEIDYLERGLDDAVWNTTKTPGKNIVGGPYLGGNYWAKPDGTGFSQNCNDWNEDGIGDLPYNINGTEYDYFPLVFISKDKQPVFPVADFSVNVTGGYVPLSVLFTDLSQNATSRIWDFDNDGIVDSKDKTPVYVYPMSGTYTVNLTVSNANGTFSKLYPITAYDRPRYILKEAQITTNKYNQTMPAIYGDRIVYLDDRNGPRYHDIYMYNLSTSRETRITTNSSYHYNTGPEIYGDRIVWQEFRSTGSPDVLDRTDIHMYNLSASKETQITNSGKAFYPDIYGDRIVWTDTRNGNGDIYMYDLSTSKETRITTNESHQDNPAIYGDKIVWEDSRNGSNIYMYDLSTSTETQITADDSDQYSPDICGDKIVWKDSRNGSNIYMYDLSTSKESRITTIQGYPGYHAIYGDRIIWVDDRSRNGDIYMYNLSTNAETQITSNKSLQSSPAIYGDRIVWTDWRNDYTVNGFPHTNSDIYMCTVSGIEPSLKIPVADFFANVTSGDVPLKILFTDNSTDAPMFWNWNFGDGIKSKHALNATHTFTKPGKYDVSLTVTNENGSNTRIIPQYITVT